MVEKKKKKKEKQNNAVSWELTTPTDQVKVKVKCLPER